MKSKESTCALNLRGFSTDLKWECRQKASKKHETLLHYVERVLREDLKKAEEANPQGKTNAKRNTS
jgi:hypothetical protein